MSGIMLFIGLGIIGWLLYKMFEDAKEQAWEEGFEDGRKVGMNEGKLAGTVETVCDLINVDFNR